MSMNNPQYQPQPPPVAMGNADAWQQQQQFLQWQQFQQWQQMQQQQPPQQQPQQAAVPAFGSALSEPVPQQQDASVINSNKDSSVNASSAGMPSTSTTDTTGTTSGATSTAGTAPAGSSGGGGLFDGILGMIGSMNTGVSSVNTNSATLLKSLAASATQLQQFMKVFKTCGAAST
jgi:hypothetical protein